MSLAQHKLALLSFLVLLAILLVGLLYFEVGQHANTLWHFFTTFHSFAGNIAYVPYHP